MPGPTQMTRVLGRCWRVCATGLCFAAFGVGGLLLRVLVFPLLNVLVRERGRRVACARDARLARMLPSTKGLL